MTGEPWRSLMRTLPPNADIGWMTANDGVPIRYLQAKAVAPRGTIVFVNGRTDFLEKYNETYRDFLAAGWSVAAPEWRGQGLSGRELDNSNKGYVRSYHHYVADLRRFISEVLRSGFSPPFVLIGYSMGGLAAALYLVETGGEAFISAILVAPLLRARTDGAPNWAARSMARWMTTINLGNGYCVGRGDFNFDDGEQVWPKLVTSPERFYEVREYIRRQPQLALGGPTWRWLDATFDAIKRVSEPAAFAKVVADLHFIVAENDQLLFNSATRQVADNAGGHSYVEIAGAQHDLFIEQTDIRERAIAAILGILETQAAAP
jgi:lysophospholipase